MHDFDVRPLGAFAATFYVISCFLYSCERSGRTAFLILSLVAFAVVVLLDVFVSRKFCFRVALTVITAGALTSSFFSIVTADISLAKLNGLVGEKIEITATVRTVDHTSSYGGCYTVETDPDATGFRRVKMILYTDNGELDTGDIVRGRVLLSSVMDSDIYERYVLAEGAVLWGESTDTLEVIGHDNGIMTKLSDFRTALSSKLKAEMSDEGGGFAAAMILGDKSDLALGTTRDFRTLGISHVIALSGTHLTSLMVIALFLIPCGKRIKFFLVTPLVLFYMALTGFSASVVRAAIMCIIASAGAALNKKYDVFTSLAVSVLLICVFNVYAPFDVGLQLSFVSVAGLMVSDFISMRIPDPEGKILRAAKRAVVAAFVVPVVLLPVMWLRFGEMSLAAPLANIVLAPVISLLIPVLGVLLVVSAVPTVFSFVACVADVLILILLKATKFFANICDSVIVLGGVVVSVIVILFTVSFVFALFCTGRIRRVIKFVMVFLLCLTVVFAQVNESYARTGMTVYFNSDGGDDCVYINSGRQNVLVDIGRHTSALKHGEERGENVFGGRIDVLMLSHLHRSHRMSVHIICENNYVSALWLPAPYNDDSSYVYESLMGYAERIGVDVHTYVSGETLVFGDCELSAPKIGDCSYSDHPTISFCVKYGDHGFVYCTPDAETDGYPSGYTYVVGSHGPAPKGIPADFGTDTVVTYTAAEKFECIPDTAVVSDKAVIRYLPGRLPVTEFR